MCFINEWTFYVTQDVNFFIAKSRDEILLHLRTLGKKDIGKTKVLIPNKLLNTSNVAKTVYTSGVLKDII